MSKSKILLFAYTKVNLGDNLFIYMLTKRYPNVDFYIHVVEPEYENVYKNVDNLHYIYESRNINELDINRFDAYIYVGGSIFMESEYGMHELKEFNKFLKTCKENNKKFFYISCNFGPYKTQEYYNLARENFKMCEGVCFRDKKSYELFKDISSVRYAPDMAFSIDNNSMHIKKENRSIGISVINLLIRDGLKEFWEPYKDLIKRIIIKFAKRNYKIYLFSFSEFEKDTESINEILSIVPDKYKNKIEIVEFNEDIETYLKSYSKVKKMICGRFHSMILSILFNQKIYNLTYSKKQDNVIEELKLFKRYQQINKIDFNTVVRSYYFKKVNRFKLKKIAKEAEGQFKDIDNYLLKNS